MALGNSPILNNTILGNYPNLGRNIDMVGNFPMIPSSPGLGNSTINNGLLSSLVGLAGTPNNNSNIVNSLGGFGKGFDSLQNGLGTLNTLNKVNNAMSGVKGIFD